MQQIEAKYEGKYTIGYEPGKEEPWIFRGIISGSANEHSLQTFKTFEALYRHVVHNGGIGYRAARDHCFGLGDKVLQWQWELIINPPNEHGRYVGGKVTYCPRCGAKEEKVCPKCEPGDDNF